jgi:hypothetical protein
MWPDESDFKALTDEHREWLRPFDPRHRKNWERVLKGNVEAGLCEAAMRRRLEAHGCTVEPNERLNGKCGGPDFRCSVGVERFYVEVSCIPIKVAQQKTGVRESEIRPRMKNERRPLIPVNRLGLTESIFNKCGTKTRQCGNLDGPVLVAVGTFDAMAALLCFQKTPVACVLTGNTKLGWTIDVRTGEQVGETYQVTNFDKAAFLQFDDKIDQLTVRSSEISGVLLCGLPESRFPGCSAPESALSLQPNTASANRFRQSPNRQEQTPTACSLVSPR